MTNDKIKAALDYLGHETIYPGDPLGAHVPTILSVLESALTPQSDEGVQQIYTVAVDPSGKELQVTASSSYEAHKKAWNLLSDDEKQKAASLEVVDIEDQPQSKPEAALQGKPRSEEVEILPFTEVVDYILHYGSGCRDCADHDGTCGSDGKKPCDYKIQKGMAEHAVKAINYGVHHGYLKANLRQHSAPVDAYAVDIEKHLLQPLGQIILDLDGDVMIDKKTAQKYSHKINEVYLMVQSIALGVNKLKPNGEKK